MRDDTPKQTKSEFCIPIHNVIVTDVHQFYLKQANAPI